MTTHGEIWVQKFLPLKGPWEGEDAQSREGEKVKGSEQHLVEQARADSKNSLHHKVRSGTDQGHTFPLLNISCGPVVEQHLHV